MAHNDNEGHEACRLSSQRRGVAPTIFYKVKSFHELKEGRHTHVFKWKHCIITAQFEMDDTGTEKSIKPPDNHASQRNNLTVGQSESQTIRQPNNQTA